MYPYILCFCGRSIGEYYDYFKAVRAQLYADLFGENEFDPILLPISEDVQVNMGPVFDSLHIHLECCRTRLTTLVEFKDIY